MARSFTVALSLLITLVCLAATGPLLPAQDGPRGDAESDLAAARKRSADNLKKIAKAVIEYADKEGRVPPPALLGADGRPQYSWRVLVLPYLGEKQLYEEFRPGEPWDGPHNKALLAKMPRVYPPVRGKPREPYATFYQAIVGPGAGLEARQRLHYPGSYPDGLANTVMLAEAAEAVPWSKPADLPYDPSKPLPRLGGLFPDGFHVAMWNANTHFFKRDFDEREMRHVITRAGGELMDFGKLER
jgi:hypothetical protein